MKDCRLTITVRNDDIRCEMENISMVELATLSGYLQMLVGQEAIARGVDIEEVKTNLLDVHLESMISLEDQLKQGKLKVNNEEVEYGEEEDYDRRKASSHRTSRG